MKFYTFKIIIEPEEEKNGGYYAYPPALRAGSPDLHGCYSNGATIEETRANMQEAIEQHLEALLEENKPIPYFVAKKPVYTESFTVVTIPMHTGKDIGKGLANKILKDGEYSAEEFVRLK